MIRLVKPVINRKETSADSLYHANANDQEKQIKGQKLFFVDFHLK